MQTHEMKLPGSLRIENCTEFKSTLDPVVADNLDLTLLCKDLETLDAAGAQLLAAVQIEIESRDGKVIWKDPSDALKLACATLGFPRLT